jgi:hypothetical protein
MLTVSAFVIFLSLLIGYFGRHRKIGFWGMAFGSMLLTPLIGLIILLVTDDVKPEQESN